MATLGRGKVALCVPVSGGGGETWEPRGKLEYEGGLAVRGASTLTFTGRGSAGLSSLG